jgi:hypothetical protein
MKAPACRRARTRQQSLSRQGCRRTGRRALRCQDHGADLDAALAVSDCLIDFTRPEGTLQHLEACRRHKVSLVIGTTGFRRRASRPSRLRAGDPHRLRAEHGGRRQCGVPPARCRRAHPQRRLRHRSDRGASPAQGRCALRHRPAHGRSGGRGARPRACPTARCTAAKAIPASGRRPRSAFRPYAAATSSAITRCSSPAAASASRSPTNRPVACPMRRAPCAPGVS